MPIRRLDSILNGFVSPQADVNAPFEPHRLLARQLRKAGVAVADGEVAAPPDTADWRAFVRAVDAAYRKHDGDRELTERSLAIAGEELAEQACELTAVNVELDERVRERTRALDAAALAAADRVAELSRLESVIDATNTALVTTDRAGRIEHVNAAFTRISGYALDEAVGRRPGELLQGDATDVQTRAMMRDHLARGEGFECEILNYAKDGRQYWLALEVRPIRDDAGEVTNFIAIERDITEAKRTQAALRDSEERQKLILDTALDAVVTMDCRGNISSWNAQAEVIFGWTAAEAIGRPLAEVIVPEEFRDAHTNGFERFLATGEAQAMNKRLELPAVRRSGQRFPCELAIVPLRRGETIEFSGFIRDVTDRAEAERQLRENDERFQRIAANTPGTLLQYVRRPDGSHAFPFVSDGVEEMFGVTVAEVLADADVLWARVHPDDVTVLDAVVEASAESLDSFEWQGRFLRNNGERRFMTVHGRPERRDDGTTIWDGLLLDVTRQVQAEAKLQESEERLASIAGNVPGMVYRMEGGDGAARRFTYVSDGCRDLYGVEPEELLADADLVNALIHPADLPSLTQASRRATRTGERIDWTGRHLPEPVPAGQPGPIDGEEPAGTRWLNVLARSRRCGRVTRTDGVILDATDRVLADRDLKLARDRAEAAQHEAEAAREEAEAAREEAEAAREAAEAASVAKSAFLANMSHEIRTPLSHVISFGELIEGNLRADAEGTEPLVPLPPADRLHAASTICRSGKHLLSVLDDVLDLSKIEAGRMTVEALDVDPASIMEDVASLMRVRAVDKGLVLDVRYATAIPRSVTADPTRLRQSLMNLVGNALKFTQRGGVLIQASVDDVEEPRTLKWSVVDTGIGMTDAQRGRLFEPFTQADDSTTRRFGGTGLGLAVSRRLARLMGGDLSCRSVEGEGSTFTIELPIRPEEALHMMLHNQPPAANGGFSGPLAGRRILVVEDGPENQWLIGMHLRNGGAIVESADNGKLGVDAVRKSMIGGTPFDAVLMDMQMPVMDGYTAAGEVRRLKYDGPVVAFTAHAMSGDREKCLAAGCDAYTTKPINGGEMIATLARLIEGGRHSQAA